MTKTEREVFIQRRAFLNQLLEALVLPKPVHLLAHEQVKTQLTLECTLWEYLLKYWPEAYLSQVIAIRPPRWQFWKRGGNVVLQPHEALVQEIRAEWEAGRFFLFQGYLIRVMLV